MYVQGLAGYYKNGVPVTAAQYGDVVTYDIPGHAPGQIYLNQTVNGRQGYQGSFTIPMAPYTLSPADTAGLYSNAAYEWNPPSGPGGALLENSYLLLTHPGQPPSPLPIIAGVTPPVAPPVVPLPVPPAPTAPPISPPPVINPSPPAPPPVPVPPIAVGCPPGFMNMPDGSCSPLLTTTPAPPLPIVSTDRTTPAPAPTAAGPVDHSMLFLVLAGLGLVLMTGKKG